MKIAAVVVTFNRLNMLKECIKSIKSQTKKVDEIIVVNNSSTDDTLVWLNKQNDLTILTQENLGGAGGFYTGIKYAYEKKYNWIWCFDDDCILDKNAFDELFPFVKNEKLKIYNSLVISKENKKKLSFGLYNEIQNKFYEDVASLDNDIIGSANFFNGTLIPISFVENYGLPLKYFYIKGDEYEYFLRAKNNNIEIVTILNSQIYHPPEKYIIVENFFFRHRFIYMSSSKRYYSTRNQIIIRRIYKNIKQESVIKKNLLNLIMILFREKSVSNSWALLKGMIKGYCTKIDKVKIK